MHLVRARFHPIEEPAQTIPAAILPNFLGRLAWTDFSFDYPSLISFSEILKPSVNIDLALKCIPNEIALTLLHLCGLKRLDYAVPHAHATIRTGSDRVIKREQTGRGWADVNVTIRTMPAS